ncbi:MAG: DUF4864 domain-containing protein [Pseudomonadota bacterium]
MRGVFQAMVAVMLSVQAMAQSAGEVIEGVIQNQLNAFQADDFDTAFTYASPMIQGMFGSPERFGQMVRQGYPMVWRPAGVEYTALTERGGRFYQNVLITDQAGQLHLLEYEMIETPDGWEINGVQFKRPGALGA